jgi:LPPG:FO 2-phospho-L-lactate transferase
VAVSLWVKSSLHVPMTAMAKTHRKKALLLAGGVGGGKLARGLAAAVDADLLTIIVNVADDFQHFGLKICPDLDSVLYAMAGVANAETGWGREAETWNFMSSMKDFGGDSWFRLGDKDLATHVFRTSLLRTEISLSEVTLRLCQAFHIRARLAPATDAEIQTVVHTREGQELSFQAYFVQMQCKPQFAEIEYRGAAEATPSEAFLAAVSDPALSAIIIAPSNPVLSISPILAIPQITTAFGTTNVPVVAISPIVSGKAIKGPAAKILAEIGIEASALGIAQFYQDRIDGIVIDTKDAKLARQIEDLGIAVHVTNTIMITDGDRERLAQDTLQFCERLGASQ